ncbi:MAG: hypothetical protein ACREQJ_08610 [Candidatus Binatia bacterium]
MRSIALSLSLTSLLLFSACGLKGDPRPSELVRPKSVVDLAGEIVPEGIRLRWSRPDTSVDGERLDDLGGFLVFRGTPGTLAEEIAQVPVLDRERFKRQKGYEHLDKTVAKGNSYYYRIVAFTADDYYSAPSNQVSVTLEP